MYNKYIYVQARQRTAARQDRQKRISHAFLQSHTCIDISYIYVNICIIYTYIYLYFPFDIYYVTDVYMGCRKNLEPKVNSCICVHV